MKPILEAARDGHYGVVAPNINNEPSCRAAIAAACEMNAPVILDIGGAANPDIAFLSEIAAKLAKEAPVPVAINLDHGGAFEIIMKAIASKFTSVMVDRSTLPFEENVAQVKEVVKIAHAVGKTVEAELGHVGQATQYSEDRDRGLTTVEEAQAYIDQTGVDFLAVAIGTSHGLYPKGMKPVIDFDRLKELRAAVEIPLVLHGSSGTAEEDLAKCAKLGISKFNIASDNFQAARECAMAHCDTQKPHEFLEYYYEGYKNQIKHYMELVGAKGNGGMSKAQEAQFAKSSIE